MHNDFLDWWRNDLGESKHPVFGKVNSGMDVVMKIGAAPTCIQQPPTNSGESTPVMPDTAGKTRCDANDNPVTPVKMLQVTIA